MAPSEPLRIAVVVRPGSFARTRANPEPLRLRVQRELEKARVFATLLDTPPEDGTPSWSLLLSAADYGEPDAYSFELSGLLVREREPIADWASKQSARQRGGGQLTIGPPELAQLAERAILDLVRQIAADTDRLRQEL